MVAPLRHQQESKNHGQTKAPRVAGRIDSKTRLAAFALELLVEFRIAIAEGLRKQQPKHERAEAQDDEQLTVFNEDF